MLVGASYCKTTTNCNAIWRYRKTTPNYNAGWRYCEATMARDRKTKELIMRRMTQQVSRLPNHNIGGFVTKRAFIYETQSMNFRPKGSATFKTWGKGAVGIQKKWGPYIRRTSNGHRTSDIRHPPLNNYSPKIN